MCHLCAASAGDPGISPERLCADSSQGGKQQKAMDCYTLFQQRTRYLVFFMKAPRRSLSFISDTLTSFCRVWYPHSPNWNYVQFSSQCLELTVIPF